MLDGKSADKIKCVPISDTTVARQISDIAENLELQLVSHLQTAGEFAIQLDESTDISNCAVLLVYVRYNPSFPTLQSTFQYWSGPDLRSNPKARRFEINTTLEEVKMTTKITSTCVETKSLRPVRGFLAEPRQHTLKVLRPDTPFGYRSLSVWAGFTISRTVGRVMGASAFASYL
ncbi:hypothetical protein O3P69_007205 [Scylla paramamosain]|uniref:Uncharacterized protein n=1 Tax=Scylla paramamosain TaxID=85552 RepID=A0AAW0V656_SCYPA